MQLHRCVLPAFTHLLFVLRSTRGHLWLVIITRHIALHRHRHPAGRCAVGLNNTLPPIGALVGGLGP
jgi:hypothetical protein